MGNFEIVTIPKPPMNSYKIVLRPSTTKHFYKKKFHSAGACRRRIREGGSNFTRDRDAMRYTVVDGFLVPEIFGTGFQFCNTSNDFFLNFIGHLHCACMLYNAKSVVNFRIQ